MTAPIHSDHLVNLEGLLMARRNLGGFRKSAFVPAGDPSGGGGGGPPPGDPSGGGGGAPPMDPAAAGGGGGGGPDVSALQQQIQQMQQQMMQMQQGGGMAGGGMAGGAGGALKPKIDVNAVLLSILKVQARIADQLGVKIPASEMVATQQDLQGLASATQSGGPMPGMDPTATTGPAGGGGGGGAIPPVDPMQGMQPAGMPGGEKPASDRRAYRSNGHAFDSTSLDTSGLGGLNDRASAIARVLKIARSQA